MNKLISAQLQIRLMGDFQLLVDGERASGLYSNRPQSLLAYLLLHRHAPQSRHYLAFLLWPDSSEGQALTNLRNLLHTLRRALPAAHDYILGDKTTIQWNPDVSLVLDVAQFEEALASANLARNNGHFVERLETAVALYKGDLLPGNYDDWIIPIRERLRQQFLDGLHELVTHFEGQKEYRTALRFAQRIWQQDMLDESAAVRLMDLHALNGDRAGIQRIYRTLVSNLDQELEVEPAATTQAAYQKFLQVESAQLSYNERPAKTDWQPKPLPVPATLFVGREKELADIAERLADPSCRLLTVVGLNGMGKTRLVLQTAVDHQELFADGVAYTSITPVSTTHMLEALVGETLQIFPNGSTNPRARINNFLRTRELLLVLDNFDQLWVTHAANGTHSAPNWLVELLHTAPNLKLLVTSPQRLNLVEEWVYEIGGLQLPDEDSAVTADSSGAVALFLNSARRADHHFDVAHADLESIIRICHLVDGMPLAIELAASWVRLLSCAEIVEEIEHNLNFLRTESRSLPERHRSIQAVFDHSWALLSSQEQQALARLSVFRSCFSRGSAEQEAAVDLAMLSALANKSLLLRVGLGRFKIHNLVRQYAQTKLHLLAHEPVYMRSLAAD